MRILLVEDDPMIGSTLRDGLKDADYVVDWARDGTTAMARYFVGEYDAILLDLGLPDRDGLDVLRAVRETRLGGESGASGQADPPPVIVITARGRLDDRVAGLDGGADDYLVKPFALDELLARLRAVLRRGSSSGSGPLVAGRLSLDAAAHAVSLDEGEPVPLTRREFALLRALMTRPGTVLSRDDLEYRLYGEDEQVESNAVEFTIHRIRTKLAPDVIKNVRGIGWFVPRHA